MVVSVGVTWRRRKCGRGVVTGSGFTFSAKRRHHVQSIVVALLTLVAHAASQEQEGDWCLNGEGYDGICRHLRHCPYLQSKAYVYNGAGENTPDLCSYGNGGAIVCCPTVTPVTSNSPKPTQPAVPNVPVRSSPRPPPVRRPPVRRPPAAAPRPSSDSGDSDTVTVVSSSGDVGTRISEKKCHEYMNSLKVKAISLKADGRLSEDWCPFPPPGNGLIVGGTAANPGEYPHAAALGYASNGEVIWLCGGSLISPSYVLTAAHCLRGSLLAVSLGALRVTPMSIITVKLMMEGAGENSDIYPVAESLRNPGYNIFSHYDDIALVRLGVPVRKFDSYVRPACLPTDPSNEGIRTVVACGFGHTKHQDTSTSRLLKHVTLSVYDSDVCSRVFSAVINTRKLSKGIVNSQLCAGHLDGGKDTCDGDSGGPLQITDKKNRCITRIVGVTSFGGVLCGSKNTAALYTNVAHFLPWIESVVWPSP